MPPVGEGHAIPVTRAARPTEGCMSDGDRAHARPMGMLEGRGGGRMGSISVAWWNLQNLFDTDDDPISSDLEFTVEKGWTAEAFAARKASLAACCGS